MSPSAIDALEIHFESGSLLALNLILGLIMFGVALALRVEDFRQVARSPRAPIIGLLAQFLLLPAGTWLLTRALGLPPSISLGMILVASCPGGNISNFMAHLARANTALSISLTAISTAAAIVMTPLNVTFWGSLSADTREVLTSFHIDPLQMFVNVMLLLGIPLVAGMSIRHWRPQWADRAVRPFKVLSIVLFVLLVLIAFQSNYGAFVAVIGVIFVPVALHNAVAWLLGWGAGRAAGLARDDVRALSIEVAIQNSGLGLVLVFGFFGGLGGMAVVAGWWGIWHIVAGLAVAGWWSRRP